MDRLDLSEWLPGSALNRANRRVRTRSHGGVEGESREAPLIPIHWNLVSTCALWRDRAFVLPGGFEHGVQVDAGFAVSLGTVQGRICRFVSTQQASLNRRGMTVRHVDDMSTTEWPPFWPEFIGGYP